LEIGPTRPGATISTLAMATGKQSISLQLISGNVEMILFMTHNIAHAGIQKSPTAVTEHETRSNHLKQIVSQMSIVWKSWK